MKPDLEASRCIYDKQVMEDFLYFKAEDFIAKYPKVNYHELTEDIIDMLQRSI